MSALIEVLNDRADVVVGPSPAPSVLFRQASRGTIKELVTDDPYVADRPIALRHVFARLAAGDNAALGLIRRTVAARRTAMRAMLADGEAPMAMRRAAARFADDMVIGAFRVARTRAAMRVRSMIPPLTVVAVGTYGRQTLPPAGRPELLILVGSDADGSAAAMIGDAVELLESLDFDVDYSVPTIDCAADAALTDPGLATRLRRSRQLWGRSDLFARLRRHGR